jgi:hypothetical protein
MAEMRECEYCHKQFTPKREHSRFDSAECRIAWNKANRRHANVSVAALDWSLTAMAEATAKLARARSIDSRHAVAAVSDATWWVTIVDATLVRYYPDSYDALLDSQPQLQREEIEQTLAGLRYVRNQMGVHLDPAEFISQDGGALAWSLLPPPDPGDLSQRGQEWENSRHRAYTSRLAGQPVARAFKLAGGFLRVAAEAAPAWTDEETTPPPAVSPAAPPHQRHG